MSFFNHSPSSLKLSLYFPTSYSSNPSIHHRPLCALAGLSMRVRVCVPGGCSCAAAAGGRGIPEPAHRNTIQTDLSKTHTKFTQQILRSALVNTLSVSALQLFASFTVKVPLYVVSWKSKHHRFIPVDIRQLVVLRWFFSEGEG